MVKGAAVCYDASTHFLKLLYIIYNLASEEGCSIFKGWLIDNNCCALGLDSLHNSLD